MKPALISTLIGLPLLISCGKEEPRAVSASAAPAVAVQTAAVSVREWPEIYEATGTVRARATVTISSKTMGYVRQVDAQVGSHVRQGQTLVVLEARDLEANVLRAEAARSEVQSAVPEAEHGVAAAKANLDLAQSTFRRMEDLASKKSISSQEFDEAAARLKGAQANYEMARSRRAQLDARAAQVDEEIRAAMVMRDYARIAAPFAGIVTAKSVEPGNLASPGVPLLTIEQEGAYRLEVSVDESRMPSARPGQSAQVALEAIDRKLDARISEVVPAVDASSRAYTVKIDLPALPQIRSGMFGRAAFALASRKVVVAPVASLQERGQLASVFVAEDGVAHTRLITLGQRSGDAVEILSGLNAGEKVVAPIAAGLSDGARIEVLP